MTLSFPNKQFHPVSDGLKTTCLQIKTKSFGPYTDKTRVAVSEGLSFS